MTPDATLIPRHASPPEPVRSAPRPLSVSKVMKDAPLPLAGSLEFLSRLWAVGHALQSISKRMEHSSGVTGPQRLVLRIVGAFPQSSAGQIARALQVHPSTLTGVLRRLEQRGLVERRADPTDARRALFVLSQTGAAANASLESPVERAVERVLAATDLDDTETARRVLAKVQVALESAAKEKPGRE